MDTSLETDVVVVGGGGSGLCAAIAAVSAGARTILLEKRPALGGTTGLSVGSITASGTSWQKRKGIDDSRDEHFEDMAKFLGPLADRDNLALRRLLVDNVTETLEWLTSIGVAFFGPMPEPPHRRPRMHNVLPNSRAYPYWLGREARRVGVDIRLQARVTQLLRGDDGRVTGVEARMGDGAIVRVTARRGVVLASGDISAATDFKQRFRPDVAHVDAINPESTGDGQRMGLELGASVVNGDLLRGPTLRFKAPARDNLVRRLPPWPLLTGAMKFALDHLPMWMFRPFIMSFMTSSMAPEPALFRAGTVLVNTRGERFTDELGQPAVDVARQPDKGAWLVFDDRIARRFSAWPHFISTAPGLAYAYMDDYRRTRRDLYRRAPTLEALASGMGVPPDALQASIAAHNATLCAAAGSGAPGDERTPLEQGPFHALGPVHSWIVLADVGLAVDARLRVLDGEGSPVPGLWAAGSAGQGGAILSGHGHHIGWAMTSGRLAGRFAAGDGG